MLVRAKPTAPADDEVGQPLITRALKGFRRIFSRFEKLDVMFTAFIHFALIADALR